MAKLDSVKNVEIDKENDLKVAVLAKSVIETQLPLHVVAYIQNVDKIDGIQNRVQEGMIAVFERIRKVYAAEGYSEFVTKIRERISDLYCISEEVLNGNSGVYSINGKSTVDRLSSDVFVRGRGERIGGVKQLYVQKKAKPLNEAEKLNKLANIGEIYLDINTVKREEGVLDNSVDSFEIGQILSSPEKNIERLRLYVETVFIYLCNTAAAQNEIIDLCSALKSANFTCKGRKDGYTVFEMESDLVGKFNIAALSNKDRKGQNGEDTPPPASVLSTAKPRLETLNSSDMIVGAAEDFGSRDTISNETGAEVGVDVRDTISSETGSAVDVGLRDTLPRETFSAFRNYIKRNR